MGKKSPQSRGFDRKLIFRVRYFLAIQAKAEAGTKEEELTQEEIDGILDAMGVCPESYSWEAGAFPTKMCTRCGKQVRNAR